jgi:hypothetical protein
MNKISLILLSLMFFMPGQDGFGQSTEDAAIKEVINRLFTGMETGDTAVMRAAFTDGATLVSVYRDKSNTPVLRRDPSVDTFLKVIATPHPEPYIEETWNMKILVDGDFAQAWCDFGLYVGKKFSHCGVDAFHLHKTMEGWKIFHLADTRRTVGCEVPNEIQLKHK